MAGGLVTPLDETWPAKATHTYFPAEEFGMKILPPSPTSSGYAPLPAAPEKPRQNFYCIPAGIPIDAVEPKAIYAFLCHQRGDCEGAYTALVSTAHTSPQFATLWGQKALELGERKAAAQIFSWTNIWLASANIPAPHDCKYAHFTRLNEVCALGLGMTHGGVLKVFLASDSQF